MNKDPRLLEAAKSLHRELSYTIDGIVAIAWPGPKGSAILGWENP